MDICNNLDEYESIGTQREALYVNANKVYFDSFGVEPIAKSL